MLRTLQSGRALAAISVVAFHLSCGMALSRYGGNSPFIDYTKHGYLGVDFFFVLSGFIIFYAHQQDVGRPEMWRDFAYKRFSRLFPAYWLYTCIFVLLLFCGFGQNAKLPENILGWVSAITLIRFSESTPPLPPAWTLFHEIQFYALFSLLIFSRRLGMIALGSLAAIAIVFYHFPGEENRNAINVYSSAYLIHFLFGMAAYWRYQRKGSGFADTILGATFLAAGFAMLPVVHPITLTIIACGFACTLAGVSQMEARHRFRCPKVLNFLGDASYSIYLTHEAVMGLGLKIALKTNLYGITGPGVTYFLVLGFCLAAGSAAYYFIERPLLIWMRERRSRSLSPTPVKL